MKPTKRTTSQPRFNNNLRYEVLKGESQTINSETYSIRELYAKHAGGIMPDINRNGINHDSATHNSLDLQKINRMDIFDKETYKTQISRNIEDMRIEISEVQSEAKKNKQKLQEAKTKAKSESIAKAQQPQIQAIEEKLITVKN